MLPETSPPPSRSFLSWMVMALGPKYAILLPLSALIVFVLTVLVVARGKGSMVGAALAFLVPIPFLIGIYSAIEGGIMSGQVMATMSSEARPGQLAEAASIALVGPLVGMSSMAPSYLVAAIGLLIRAFSASREGHKAGG